MNDSTTERNTLAVLSFIAILALLVPSVILRAFVFARLWGWFIVPLGLPAIGVAHAAGIAVIVALLLSSVRNQTKKVERETEGFSKPFKEVLVSFSLSLASWGVGAIAYGFMS